MKKAADIESGDLKLGEKYASFNFTMGLSKLQSTFCFDQSKANLLYLVEPRVDSEGIGAALNNPIATDIDDRMDTTTWWELKKLPLQFIEYWFSIDNGITALATHWPSNYKTLMTERAHAAQKRILGVVDDGNVVRLNFPKSSTVAGARNATPRTAELPDAMQVGGGSNLAPPSFVTEKPALAEIAETQFKLGKKFANGDGIKRDDQKAAEWYLKSAQKGHPKSQNNLGLMYLSGIGVQQDKEEAARWLMKAAEQNLIIAQYNLADLYFRGFGVPRDEATAAAWYRKAADQGNSDAQCSLAEMFEDGRGVPQDDGQAEALYFKAALQDNETAQAWLWRRANLGSLPQAAPQYPGTTIELRNESAFKLPTDSAVAVVRAAIELLKQNPVAFSTQLIELRALLLATNGNETAVADGLPIQSKDESIPTSVASPLLSVVRWLVDFDSISFAELRSKLLPLDLLPAAVIDEINERALDLTREIALDHIDDAVVVCRKTLTEVLRAAE